MLGVSFEDLGMGIMQRKVKDLDVLKRGWHGCDWMLAACRFGGCVWG